jgi:hypothetical protein
MSMSDNTYELPIIEAADYDAFRDLPTHDLPNTYNEWLKLFAERKLEYGQRGFRIVEVKVNSREFARYLSATGQRGNLKTLADFTLEKSSGNHY